jgi:hypothetical protein
VIAARQRKIPARWVRCIIVPGLLANMAVVGERGPFDSTLMRLLTFLLFYCRPMSRNLQLEWAEEIVDFLQSAIFLPES